MIKAQVVGDSISGTGSRITTMLVTLPRIILAELNTHRVFSRNSASSRAIPFEKMVDAVEENPFVPLAWQKNHKGMQGTEYITDPDQIQALKLSWHQGLDDAVWSARKLYSKGLTKQICNRLLEPFMWHTCLITSTEWENFFNLRCPKYKVSVIKRVHVTRYTTGGTGIEPMGYPDDMEVRFYKSRKDLLKQNTFEFPLTDLQWLEINEGQAEIHMMALAEAMWDAYNESTPKKLEVGEWHIPFEDKIGYYESDRLELSRLYGSIDGRGKGMENVNILQSDLSDHHLTYLKVKISTVMAARTSYTVVGEGQKPLSYQRMIEIHDEMKNADPFHASPFEHCARCANPMVPNYRNFKGWMQYRQIIEEGLGF